MRLFIAIKIPSEIQKRLNRIGCQLAESAPSVRPVSADNIHLTLHFLGEIDEAASLEVSDMVRAAAAKHHGFNAAVNSLGSFGKSRAPTVLWAGVEPARELLALHASLAAGLKELSIPVDERDYRPHLTIAGVKPGRGVRRLQGMLEKLESDFGTITAGKVFLIKSTLTPDGSVYETISTAPLNK